MSETPECPDCKKPMVTKNVGLTEHVWTCLDCEKLQLARLDAKRKALREG